MHILIYIASTTVNIKWSEGFFRATSVVMGLLTLWIVVCTVYYCLAGRVSLESLIFFGVILMSYLIPLITNFNNIRLGHFIKGVIYVIYLTPTYINIITIYSFSNISDVTWGSRPTGVTNEASKEDKEKQMNFKDYFSILFPIKNKSTWNSIYVSIHYINSYKIYYHC